MPAKSSSKRGGNAPTGGTAEKSSLTHNQQAVLVALETSDTPCGAYEILDAVRKDGLRAPLQVYRALDTLIGRGLVHRIESLNAFVACEHGPHTDPAGFIICDTCRRAVEVSICECADHLTASARAVGFTVERVRVEMSGLCADCQAGISTDQS